MDRLRSIRLAAVVLLGLACGGGGGGGGEEPARTADLELEADEVLLYTYGHVYEVAFDPTDAERDTDLSVRAWIEQGGTLREANERSEWRCPPIPGRCVLPGSFDVEDRRGGHGRLVAGPATLVVEIARLGGPVLAMARSTLTLVAPPSGLTTSRSTVVIHGEAVGYTLLFTNPGPTDETELWYQSRIEQGTTRRAAGGGGLLCDTDRGEGFLAAGDLCALVSGFHVNDETASGSGTFVPGPATLILEVLRGDLGEQVQSFSAPITLVAAP